MILGVHGSKDSHTKQSSHAPTIKLTKKQNKTHTGFSELLLFEHPVAVLIRHKKKKAVTIRMLYPPKEEQSRCSEISEKVKISVPRALTMNRA